MKIQEVREIIKKGAELELMYAIDSIYSNLEEVMQDIDELPKGEYEPPIKIKDITYREMAEKTGLAEITLRSWSSNKKDVPLPSLALFNIIFDLGLDRDYFVHRIGG